MRQLQIGEDVLGPDGARVGKVERMVIDERARRITHLVVHGRAIEIGHFQDAGPDGLAADISEADLNRFPKAAGPPFAPPGEHWQTPAGYAREAFVRLMETLGGMAGRTLFTPPTDVDFTDSFHAITSGSPVWHGDESLGEVDRVLWGENGVVSELVVRQGGRSYLVPTSHVAGVDGNNIQLDLSQEELHGLEGFDPLEMPE